MDEVVVEQGVDGALTEARLLDDLGDGFLGTKDVVVRLLVVEVHGSSFAAKC